MGMAPLAQPARYASAFDLGLLPQRVVRLEPPPPLAWHHRHPLVATGAWAAVIALVVISKILVG